MMGQATPSASLQATQNWEEDWAKINFIKPKKGKCQVLLLVRNNPGHQGKLRLTAGK